MLPIAPPPDAALAFGGTTPGNPFAGSDAAQERRLDQPPAGGEVCVALGQGPHRVQVIGQHDNRIDRERMMSVGLAKGATQGIDVVGQQSQSTVRQIDRKEERASGQEITTVVCQSYWRPR